MFGDGEATERPAIVTNAVNVAKAIAHLLRPTGEAWVVAQNRLDELKIFLSTAKDTGLIVEQYETPERVLARAAASVGRFVCDFGDFYILRCTFGTS